MLKLLIEASHRGGEVLKRGQGRRHERTKKGPLDYATDMDVASQEAIVATLSAAYPHIPFVGEEQPNPHISSSTFFTGDPMDATFIYETGCVEYGVGLAYVEDGELSCGVIYLPARDLTMAAERGKGCTINGARVRLRHDLPLRETIIGVDMNTRQRRQAVEQVLAPLVEHVQATRILSSSLGSEVALLEGNIGAYVHLNGAYIWDYAAGALGIMEAGGVAFTPNGDPPRWDAVKMHLMFAANAQLRDELLPYVRSAKNTLLD